MKLQPLVAQLMLVAASTIASASTDATGNRWSEIKFGMYRWLLDQGPACAEVTAPTTLADIVGEALRFVGHDFMSDFMVDACIGLEHPENAGLTHTLTQVFNNSQVCPPDISKADCAVLLSEVAMDVTARPYGFGLRQSPAPRSQSRRRLDDNEDPNEGNGVETLYLNDAGYAGVLDMSLSVGRKDIPLGTCETGHPVTGKGLGGPPIGTNEIINFTELWRVLSGDFQCDFNEENVVAIMGVHTVGRASRANTGITGFWVDPQRTATPDCQDGPQNGCMPSTFDKAYYDGFFDMGWMKDDTGMWRCIPDSMGVDISSLDEDLAPNAGSNYSGLAMRKPGACFPNSLRLPADMIIMFNLTEETDRCEWIPVPGTDGARVQSSCQLRGTWGEVLEYAVDNDEWLVAFREAWVKMVTCGHSGLSPFPHMSSAAAEAAFYTNGTLTATLNDGSDGGAGCGGVCAPFRRAPEDNMHAACFTGMLSSDPTSTTMMMADGSPPLQALCGVVLALLLQMLAFF